MIFVLSWAFQTSAGRTLQKNFKGTYVTTILKSTTHPYFSSKNEALYSVRCKTKPAFNLDNLLFRRKL